jgi:hypothetical protein
MWSASRSTGANVSLGLQAHLLLDAVLVGDSAHPVPAPQDQDGVRVRGVVHLPEPMCRPGSGT